jgi:hypothetical protein
MENNEEKKTWLMEFQGQGFSLNDFYSQGHFSKRVALKDKYSDIFRSLIDEAGVTYMAKYTLTCIYNSAHDPSNISGMIKVFEDAMTGYYNRRSKKYKYPPLVQDDSKKYCKGIYIEPDLSLKKNTFKFIIEEQ